MRGDKEKREGREGQGEIFLQSSAHPYFVHPFIGLMGWGGRQ